jgi:tetraacyldisaccharide 4'-kinase
MGGADTQARWQSVWARRDGLARWLWPISQIYRALWTIRRWMYQVGFLRSDRMPVPVIVVGNVVVGGAGKTPTVIALINHLKSRGWTPGVVSRGHGRDGEHTREVFDHTPAEEGGDEPCLIRRSTMVPVFVARRRAQAARALLAAHPDVNLLVCDDGLQHLALARDIAVAVFDDRGTGNGWLLPAGMLREPWPPRGPAAQWPDMVLRQMRQPGQASFADAAPLPVPDGMPCFWAHRRLANAIHNQRGESRDLATRHEKPVTAVAGIARPGVFFDMLTERGVVPDGTVALSDHADTKDYLTLLQQRGGTLLCTEKDAVKLFACLPQTPENETPVCWAVPLELSPDAAFFDSLDHRLAALAPRRLSSKDGHQTA